MQQLRLRHGHACGRITPERTATASVEWRKRNHGLATTFVNRYRTQAAGRSTIAACTAGRYCGGDRAMALPPVAAATGWHAMEDYSFCFFVPCWKKLAFAACCNRLFIRTAGCLSARLVWPTSSPACCSWAHTCSITLPSGRWAFLPHHGCLAIFTSATEICWPRSAAKPRLRVEEVRDSACQPVSLWLGSLLR